MSCQYLYIDIKYVKKECCVEDLFTIVNVHSIKQLAMKLILH